MTTVIYDGSFEGLLTAIFEIYEYHYEDVKIIAQHRQHQENIFAQQHFTNSDTVKSERVLVRLEKSIGKQGINQLMMVYLSESVKLEQLVFHAVKETIRFPDKNILENYADSEILEISKIVKSVGRESHRMKAFVRFEKLEDETFYAKIQPDFNVLPLIVNHFKERYQDQKWLIFDLKRNYGIFWDLNEISYFTPDRNMIKGLREPNEFYHEEEKNYQKLWQRYFVKTGISGRRNIKLHTQWMPKRYWKYLTEKQ